MASSAASPRWRRAVDPWAVRHLPAAWPPTAGDPSGSDSAIRSDQSSRVAARRDRRRTEPEQYPGAGADLAFGDPQAGEVGGSGGAVRVTVCDEQTLLAPVQKVRWRSRARANGAL